MPRVDRCGLRTRDSRDQIRKSHRAVWDYPHHDLFEVAQKLRMYKYFIDN
ncbi:hypothetical protein EYZ11_011987 [Aspergillus tanneri]|uniref:Uncharacterized protein n=1 Tax=Aspergillus tanneri TaxID=1220188 RepID=A0A4S3J1G0_9EURO|nr:hypothetical protein EYZ11_011987 [Aspergillus tanneri]